jgi:type IV secretory pathway VirB2 component (pilin)
MLSNARYTVGDSNGEELRATIESIIFNAHYAVGDGCILTTSNKGISSGFDNRIAIIATIVCGISALHINRGEGYAAFESIYPNACNAVGDGNGGEGGAILESKISNGRYVFWDGNRGEGGATIESPTPNICYAVGDDCILTTCNEGIRGGFDNCIAVVAAIIGCIATFYHHGSEGGANKSIISNTRYAVGDGDGGEGGAIIESIMSNTYYTVRDGDGGERGAISES